MSDRVVQGGGFVAGTLVHTDKGLVPIEEIKCGDLVLSKPEQGIGEQSFKRVLKTFRHDDKELWVIFSIRTKTAQMECIVSTYNHPYWVDGEKWKAASFIGTNDLLQYKNENEECIVFLSEPLYLVQENDQNKAWVFVDKSIDGGFYLDFKDEKLGACFSKWLFESGRSNDLNFTKEETFTAECFESTVYNIEVENNHTYYIGEYGTWVQHANYKQE